MTHSKKPFEKLEPYQGGKGWDGLGDWDWHVYTADVMGSIIDRASL